MAASQVDPHASLPPEGADAGLGAARRPALLKVEGPNQYYGGSHILRNVSFEARQGEVTVVLGRNGVGKTTLLKVCLGQLAPTEGTATIGEKVKVNYIDQTRMVLDGSGSLLDEVADGNEKVQFGNQTLGARSYLRRFLFDDRFVRLGIHEWLDDIFDEVDVAAREPCGRLPQ